MQKKCQERDLSFVEIITRNVLGEKPDWHTVVALWLSTDKGEDLFLIFGVGKISQRERERERVLYFT